MARSPGADTSSGETCDEEKIAAGLLLRHDLGNQFVSQDYQKELRFLGIVSSPSFVRCPEGNGVIERFFGRLKEQLLWLKDFSDEDELRAALYAIRERYNANRILPRHGYRTPNQVQGEWNRKLSTAS